MGHQLQNVYPSYSPQLLTPHTLSTDSTGMHGSSSGMGSSGTGSSGHSTNNSSGSSEPSKSKFRYSNYSFAVSDDGKKKFYVPGRLALLNSNQKYHISIGEISRRIGAPENMNTSLL